MKNMTKKEKNWPSVAMLAGHAEVVEAIVKSAVEDTGIPMNWGYYGGRAFVHSEGDRVKCRSALRRMIPQTDILDDEMFADYCQE